MKLSETWLVHRVAVDPWEEMFFRWYEKMPPMVLYWRRGRAPQNLPLYRKRLFEALIRRCHLRFASNQDREGGL